MRSHQFASITITFLGVSFWCAVYELTSEGITTVYVVHRELAEAGIAVYGYDHHGHGLSEPKDPRDRALVHDFNNLVSMQLLDKIT